jgi:hypothetical protein
LKNRKRSRKRLTPEPERLGEELRTMNYGYCVNGVLILPGCGLRTLGGTKQIPWHSMILKMGEKRRARARACRSMQEVSTTSRKEEEEERRRTFLIPEQTGS